jgi:polyhydroxyalkanoate synthesis regulator phasin
MREELKNILFMGLGAISLTGEKASELKNELLEKGEKVYKEGMIKNEELKRDIKEKIKDSVTVEIKSNSKEDIVSVIKDMSDDEKQVILDMLSGNNKRVIEIKSSEDDGVGE